MFSRWEPRPSQARIRPSFYLSLTSYFRFIIFLEVKCKRKEYVRIWTQNEGYLRKYIRKAKVRYEGYWKCNEQTFNRICFFLLYLQFLSLKTRYLVWDLDHHLIIFCIWWCISFLCACFNTFLQQVPLWEVFWRKEGGGVEKMMIHHLPLHSLFHLLVFPLTW